MSNVLSDEQIDRAITAIFPPVPGHSHALWLEQIGRPIARAIEAETRASMEATPAAVKELKAKNA